MSQEFEKKLKEFTEFINEKTGTVPAEGSTGVMCIEKKYIDEFNKLRNELRLETDKNPSHPKYKTCDELLLMLDYCYKEKSIVRADFPQANIYLLYREFKSGIQELEA